MTKLEQIALAIFDKVNEGGGETRWEEMSTEELEDALEWARTALGAMLEPSDEMLTAADQGSEFFAAADYAFEAPPRPKDAWRAMIHVKLNEDGG
jgi:hypothetical protein